MTAVIFTGNWTPIITHFKVFREEDGRWSVDGRDDYDNYTESCWQFDTFEEAVAAVPEFCEHLGDDNLVFLRGEGVTQVIGVKVHDMLWEYVDGERAEARYRHEIAYSAERKRNDTIVKYVGIRPSDWPPLVDMRKGEALILPSTPPLSYRELQSAEVKP